ncbi:sigma-54 interaction domain-containing protein [Aurantiacibacter suaedae]|uniref:sigma-54 interaction domain-containing protein n=1 Tax=Aurantiacibacter suaedae TaxID=2545755 RepID=UPI001F4F5E14|nr:sigma 54-interacting transcriptional regulator [Aurantiacibacter suaedae]
MSKLSVSQGFEKKHPSLAGRLAGVRSSLFLTNPVTLCDVDEPEAAGAHSIAVARADLSIMQDVSRNDAFVYSDPACELALAGLIARIAAHGMRAPIAADPHSLSIYALADRLAQTDVPALLTGPTGAGKEVLARFIHDSSPRSGKAFIAVNCAAIPETMLEAMLFGHQKGAFTGASAGGSGLFREADGGTLLLDEIAEMPIGLQAKLLRALQEGEVLPVGATRPVKVDVRIVACANRDLPTEVAEGRFREDLFYRLNVFPIHLAPLRERPGDIAPLACAMLLRHSNPERGPHRIGAGALAMLRLHTWPGNVRELENVMRRALVMAGNSAEIGPEHIVFDAPARLNSVQEVPAPQVAEEEDPKLSNIVKLSEARAIIDTLKECNGKRIEAARRLGISERTLRYRLASYREAGMDMGAVS